MDGFQRPPGLPGDFRIAGYISCAAEADALGEMARVASLLARLSRASPGAHARRGA